MKYYKIFFYILAIFIFFDVSVYADNFIPEKVRIGLYYLNNSVDSVKLGSQNGFEVGYTTSNFNLLFKDPYLTTIIVKKDVTSSYHIQVDNVYTDYISLLNAAKEFVQKGYNVYPVYNGNWKVWIGNYVSASDANLDIEKIKNNFSNYSYSITSSSEKNIQVTTDNGEIKLIFDGNIGIFQVFPIVFENQPNVIFVNGKPYRGSIKVIRQVNSDMTVINEVSLEQYLYSVVPSEMPASWNIEALKAQAVAARTYAINCILNGYKVKNMYNPLGFDMTPTTEFQVYDGYNRESEATTRAVDETKNLIIYYNNSPINAVFFSCSGGFTENSENIWISPVPYLRAVEDKYQPTDFSKRYWEFSFTPEEIKNYYKTKNIDIGDIIDIKVTSYSPSQNALEMKVIGTRGERVYQKLEIRSFMVNKSLPSLTFKILKQGGLYANIISSSLKQESILLKDVKILTKAGLQTLNSDLVYVKTRNTINKLTLSPLTFIFKGEGSGHGVGMSQWGAKGMADAGFKFDQILKYYYTGVEIK